ncbi:hypothetical protein PoB_001139500 [Plakobranchus ocellatus]|uniref:Uncharacterized protein n=1 Tax=Plakobranchus ocellatus TaxID=259542 RepID=A0AAV3YP28_9GAST|nr:hypothetical protein PoB_001139500 [Plakobranchus ocellatus]
MSQSALLYFRPPPPCKKNYWATDDGPDDHIPKPARTPGLCLFEEAEKVFECSIRSDGLRLLISLKRSADRTNKSQEAPELLLSSKWFCDLDRFNFACSGYQFSGAHLMFHELHHISLVNALRVVLSDQHP